MRILGLDPGSQVLGYGLVEADRHVVAYVAAGVIEARAALGKYQRLAELAREIEMLLDETKPAVVALEAGFVAPVKGFMMQGTLVSAAARGVCGMLAARRGLEVFEYSPATVKKHACGNGRAKKPQVAKLVAQQLGMNTVPAPDAGDALAVALTHARQALGAARAA